MNTDQISPTTDPVKPEQQAIVRDFMFSMGTAANTDAVRAAIIRDFVSPRVVSMSHAIRNFWISNKAFLDPNDDFNWTDGMKAALLAMGYDQAEIRDYFDKAMEVSVEYFKTLSVKSVKSVNLVPSLV